MANEVRKGVELVSMRFDRNGLLRNAKPCVRCSAFIKRNFELCRKITFSDDDESLVSCNTIDFYTDHVCGADRKKQK